MSLVLTADCLNYIFEYLEDYKATLFSCLLVNRLCCEIAVKILWRNSQKYNDTTFTTLITCLPNESKEILRNNGIIISALTSRPPMFNYAAFCKILDICKINYWINFLIKRQPSIVTNNIKSSTCIIEQEIFILFMKQIPSLKQLLVYKDYILYYENTLNLNLTTCPEAKVCFKNLSNLCISDIYSEPVYQIY